MDNNTCQCNPFYTGDSCETYKGCPDGLLSDVCSVVIETSSVEPDTLPPGDNTDNGGNNGGDNGGNNNIDCKDPKNKDHKDCKFCIIWETLLSSFLIMLILIKLS